MKKYYLLLLVLALCLSLGLAISCGGDDDDDNDDATDDDAADDDAADDDAADDDAADDDAADDDAADDDAADDDAADDDDDDDDNDDDDTTELFSIDFSDYSLGDLPSPWLVTEAGNSYIEILENPTAKGGEGKLLGVAGADLAGNEAYAAYPFTHTSDHLALEFDIYAPPNPGDANLQLNQDESTRAAVFSLIGENSHMILDYFTDTRLCGVYSPSTWYRIRLDVDLADATVDVWANGVMTSCEDVPLNPNATITSLGRFVIADYSGVDESGVPYFDNFFAYEWN